MNKKVPAKLPPIFVGLNDVAEQLCLAPAGRLVPHTRVTPMRRIMPSRLPPQAVLTASLPGIVLKSGCMAAAVWWRHGPDAC